MILNKLLNVNILYILQYNSAKQRFIIKHVDTPGGVFGDVVLFFILGFAAGIIGTANMPNTNGLLIGLIYGGYGTLLKNTLMKE